ncbi:MAG: hypothetical protein HQL52_14445 [Magnetococcales bacterium]|nr:hypothetical protein [Magnetococcales bacterium]
MNDGIILETVKALLRDKKEILLTDLATHLMLDPVETRFLLDPLIQSGQVERIWKAPEQGISCYCERDEALRWVGGGGAYPDGFG